MMNLFKKNTNDSFSQFVPFEFLMNDFTVVTKNNAYMRVLKVKNHDLNFYTEDEVREKMRQYNKALSRLGDNFMLHYEVQRKKTHGYITKDTEKCPLVTKIIDHIRKEEFSKRDYFQCDYYITITYLLNSNTSDELINVLSSKNKTKKENLKEKAYETYKYFDDKCLEFIESLKYVLIELEWLEGEKLMGYLYSTVNPEFSERKKCPEIYQALPLDYYLSQSSFEFGKNSMIRDNYLKTVSVVMLPETINVLFLQELEELNLEYRMSMRYVYLSPEETKKTFINIRRIHQFSKKNEIQQIYEGITGKELGSEDEVEAKKADETDEALNEFRGGGISYGYYTFTIIIWDKNLKLLEDKVRKINSILIKHDISCGEDKFNIKESYIGSIPGNIRNNIRRFLISTWNLTGFFPNSTIYRGEEWNKHLNEPPLLVAKTRKNDVFYLNLHVRDNGNTFVVGPIGRGKSVLLTTIAQAFSKYDDSQIFYFDVGGSSRVLIESMGGNFYDLGEEDAIAFQPLANIDNPLGKSFSNNFILTILEQENVVITPQIKEVVWETLTTLEEMPVNRRTISNFTFIVSNKEIKQAMKIYTIEGAYGKYFDGNEDKFKLADYQVFELGKVIREEKVISPILQYLFYKIEFEKLDKGRPTLMVVDEARYVFKNKQFVSQFEDWARTVRKKNASLVFATQSLKEVLTTEEIAGAIAGFETKILLSDTMAGNSDFHPLYRRIGLNDVEIKKIMEAEPKKEYIINNPSGTCKFETNLSPLELAYVGSTSIKNQLEFTEIKKTALNIEDLNRKWIAHKFGYNSKEYKLVDKVIGGYSNENKK